MLKPKAILFVLWECLRNDAILVGIDFDSFLLALMFILSPFALKLWVNDVELVDHEPDEIDIEFELSFVLILIIPPIVFAPWRADDDPFIISILSIEFIEMLCIGARPSVPGFNSTPSNIIFVWLL